MARRDAEEEQKCKMMNSFTFNSTLDIAKQPPNKYLLSTVYCKLIILIKIHPNNNNSNYIEIPNYNNNYYVGIRTKSFKYLMSISSFVCSLNASD